MAIASIKTAQNVNLSFQIASIGERVLAYLIDMGVFFVYLFSLGFVMDGLGLVITDTFTQFGVYNLLLFPVFFYSLYMHIFFEGRTIGKFIMKTKVVKEDGSPLEWSHYATRWMLRLVDLWLFGFSVGLIAMVMSDKRQRLGDMAANSIVVSTKKRTQISQTMLEDLEQDYTPVFNNVNILTDQDVRDIKEIYLASLRARDYATLRMLRNRVQEVLNVNSELNDKTFIDTVLKDYNYYTSEF